MDEIIVFHPLNREEIGQIAQLMLDDVSRRLKARNITVNYTDEAKEHISAKGYDKTYGARPLKRTIQELVEDKLAEEILDGNIKEGDRVTIGFENGRMAFTKDQNTAKKS